jgi:multidrug resistance efflux pump
MVQPTGSTAYEPVTDRPVPADDAQQTPQPSRPPTGRWRKWWARFLVLVLLAGAVALFLWIRDERATEAARIDVETVFLTAQPIPIETPRTGQVIAVSVQAQDRVEEGQRLGTVEISTTNSEGEPVQRRQALTAPRDGVVVDEPVTVGTTLQPGQPFVQLYDPTQMTFVTEVSLEDLPEIAPGMAARLTAEGMDRTVRATVQRIVPRIGARAQDPDVDLDKLQVVLVPASEEEVDGLVPGLQFTGYIDTSTSTDGPPLVSMARIAMA